MRGGERTTGRGGAGLRRPLRRRPGRREMGPPGVAGADGHVTFLVTCCAQSRGRQGLQSPFTQFRLMDNVSRSRFNFAASMRTVRAGPAGPQYAEMAFRVAAVEASLGRRPRRCSRNRPPLRESRRRHLAPLASVPSREDAARRAHPAA